MKYLGITQKVASQAKSSDLVSAILKALPAAIAQVRKTGFANQFAVYRTVTNKSTGAKNTIFSPVLTASKVWAYLRKNIRYKKDDPTAQRLFLPSAFTTLKTGDCKSYSIFAASIFTALGISNGLYFTSYKSTTKPSHVYNWIRKRNGKKIPVDGCFSKFGKMKRPMYIRSVSINESTLMK